MIKRGVERDQSLDGLVDGWIDELLAGLVDGWIGWIDELLTGLVDGWIDELLAGLMDGWIGRLIKRVIERDGTIHTSFRSIDGIEKKAM